MAAPGCVLLWVRLECAMPSPLVSLAASKQSPTLFFAADDDEEFPLSGRLSLSLHTFLSTTKPDARAPSLKVCSEHGTPKHRMQASRPAWGKFSPSGRPPEGRQPGLLTVAHLMVPVCQALIGEFIDLPCQ